MRKPLALVTLSLALACAQVQTTSAVEVDDHDHSDGVTYSIGNGFTGGSHPEGSHFHSSNLDELPAGNPPIILPGAAEVGGFFGDEEIRAVSEFHVDDVEIVEEAILRFEALDLFLEGITAEPSGIDGLFGQGPFVGSIDVFAYVADGVESIGDYQIETLGDAPILTFEVNDDLIGGAAFSVDITSLYNDRITAGEDLGIRLQMSDPDPDAGAITFGNFRIDLEPVTVPEPTSGLLLMMSILGSLMLRPRR